MVGQVNRWRDCSLPVMTPAHTHHPPDCYRDDDYDDYDDDNDDGNDDTEEDDSNALVSANKQGGKSSSHIRYCAAVQSQYLACEDGVI